jgi:hypothetical protein
VPLVQTWRGLRSLHALCHRPTALFLEDGRPMGASG